MCPYCEDPAYFDLTPAVKLNVSTVYVHGRFERLPKPVKVMAHLSKHPLRDQGEFKIPCEPLPNGNAVEPKLPILAKR
jgi:hypothetical protein